MREAGALASASVGSEVEMYSTERLFERNFYLEIKPILAQWFATAADHFALTQ